MTSYRVECWAQDQITSLTFFFSAEGLENYRDGDLLELLVEEGLIQLLSPNQHINAQRVIDRSSNELWSVNLVVGDEDNIYIEDLVGLRAYPST